MNDEEMICCHESARQMERAVAVMHRLRMPGGCPWDAEQTHESLVSNLIEETYELIDTIRERDWDHMREELGDVLLQVLFHAEIASEHAGFGIDEVADDLCEKMIRRHPHVFKNTQKIDTEAVLTQWDAIKRKEHDIEDKPYLEGTGKGLPALMRAWKLQKKVAKVGFDWGNAQGAFDKVREELEECNETLEESNTSPHVEEELGDLLFSVVNLCRKRGIDPEMALIRANAKFETRFGETERLLKADGVSLQEATLDEMENAWQSAKHAEKLS